MKLLSLGIAVSTLIYFVAVLAYPEPSAEFQTFANSGVPIHASQNDAFFEPRIPCDLNAVLDQASKTPQNTQEGESIAFETHAVKMEELRSNLEAFATQGANGIVDLENLLETGIALASLEIDPHIDLNYDVPGVSAFRLLGTPERMRAYLEIREKYFDGERTCQVFEIRAEIEPISRPWIVDGIARDSFSLQVSLGRDFSGELRSLNLLTDLAIHPFENQDLGISVWEGAFPRGTTCRAWAQDWTDLELSRFGTVNGSIAQFDHENSPGPVVGNLWISQEKVEVLNQKVSSLLSKLEKGK